jgi:hypothetical protein
MHFLNQQEITGKAIVNCASIYDHHETQLYSDVADGGKTGDVASTHLHLL